jgi:hypothetical protein
VAALEDHIRDAVGRLLDSLRGRLESDLGSCRDELITAAQEASARLATEAAEEATAEARRQAELQLAELRESATRDAESAARDAAEQRDRLAAEAAEQHERLTAEATEQHERLTAEAAEQRERLTADVEDLQRRLDDAQREFEAKQRELDDQERAFDSKQREFDDQQKEADAARDAQHAAAQQEIGTLKEEVETLRSDLESARQQLDATRDDVEATLRDVETWQEESDAARAEIGRLGDLLRRRDERVAQALRLPDAMRALDDAATFGEVLETLVNRAGGEAGRAAVFLVKGGRLRDWRTVGFSRASDSPRLELELSESGPMAEAVRGAEGIRAHRADPLPDFARTDEVRDAAAWPISVGGSVVAVLYADAAVADKAEEPYWPVFLSVLARHAGRVLEGITVRQAAGLLAGRASGIAPSPITRQSSGSIQ